MNEFDRQDLGYHSAQSPPRPEIDPYDDVLGTLYRKIDIITEKKLNEVVVREVNRALGSTVKAYKRQQNGRLFRTVLWFGVTAVLLVVAFGFGVKYASTDEYISANYQKLLSATMKTEIRSAVSKYLDEKGVEPVSVAASSTEIVPAIYERVLPSVVGVRIDGYSESRFRYSGEFTSSGSGVILQETADSYFIVTNYHVVEDYVEIYVDFDAYTTVTARMLGFDRDKDIAMISVSKSELSEAQNEYYRPIEIADSDQIRVGELVVAIGNPIGYSNTVTSGIVSAVDRIVEGAGLVRYIQTDAAINPGNSGGALVNSNGELIGINTAKIKDVEVEGIGFSIPSSLLSQVFPQLIERGYSVKPFIGIRGRDFSSQKMTGVEVIEIIADSSAERYGLEVGDYIVSINGAAVKSLQELGAVLGTKNVSDEITVGVYRDGEYLEIILVLGEQRVN